MRKSLLVIIVISLLLFAFCGKKKNTAESTIPGGKADNATLSDKAESANINENDHTGDISAAEPAQFAIKECTYNPENPTAFDDVTITPFLNEKFSADESVLKDVTFTYRWIVQNKDIAAAQGNKLEKRYFKKKDWIQCRVRGFFNDQETPEYRARVIRIQNSSPMLNLQTTDEFVAPGEFSYQITANDPDHDTLTYTLMAPLDLGVKLNSATGLITWLVDEAQAKKTEPVEIKFSVSDQDGGKAESSIILTFSARETEKQ